MRQQQVVRRLVAFLAVAISLSPSVSLGSLGVVDPMKGPIENGGFELGNGLVENPLAQAKTPRQPVRSLLGDWGTSAPINWEADVIQGFAEIIAPKNQGTPRSRLEINSRQDKVSGASELLQRKEDWGKWSTLHIAGLPGIKRETKIDLTDGDANVVKVKKIDIELVAEDRIYYINLYGRDNTDPNGSYTEMYRSVLALQFTSTN